MEKIYKLRLVYLSFVFMACANFDDSKLLKDDSILKNLENSYWIEIIESPTCNICIIQDSIGFEFKLSRIDEFLFNFKTNEDNLKSCQVRTIINTKRPIIVEDDEISFEMIEKYSSGPIKFNTSLRLIDPTTLELEYKYTIDSIPSTLKNRFKKITLPEKFKEICNNS